MPRTKAKPYRGTPVFTDAQKQIFKYWDGEKIRGLDPLSIQRRLLDYDEIDFEKCLLEAQNGNLNGLGELIDHIRKLFALPEKEYFENGTERGLTEMEVIEVLASFATYANELKKNFETQPTSSPAIQEV